MNRPSKRGHARRERIRQSPSYTLWRLNEEDVATPKYDPQLSPAALWVLLAYLPPHVRRQPWVRHLVQQQIMTAHQRPVVERDQIHSLAGMAQ